MNVILTTTWTMIEAGGVPTYINTLMKGLHQKNVEVKFLNLDDCFHSLYWKVIALIQACGNADRGRINISGFRLRNLTEKIKNSIKKSNCCVIHWQDVLSFV